MSFVTPGRTDLDYRPLLDHLPNAAYICDAEGLITYYNPRAAQVWGREPKLNDPTDRFCGSFKLYAADGTPLQHDECWMALALKHERGYNDEEIIVERPDGDRLTVLAYANPIHDEEGRLVGAVNTLVDITERKQSELRRSRSEQELADMFENAPVAVHLVGPDGTVLRANRAELELLGYSHDEVVGRHIAEFHADPEVIDDILRRLSAREELHDYEARLRCKDGSIRHVLISSNVLWEDDRFIHTRCFTRDVTARKEAAEARARLAAIVESSDDAIVGKNLDGTITSWNQGAERLFGYSEEEAVGRHITLIIPSDRQAEEDYILGRIRQGERVDHFETVRQHKDGKLLDISLTVSPIVDGEGRIVGASKIARDITEQKAAGAKLREQAETLATINSVAASLSAELELDRLVQAVTDAGVELSHAEFGAFFYNVLNDKGESYTLYTLSGAPREAFSKYPMPRNTHIFGPTFRGEGVVRSDDITQDPRYGQNPPYHGMPEGHLPVRSYLAVPVTSRSGEVLGGLFFGHSEPGVFTDQAEQVVTGLASHAATAIDNAQLYEQARSLNETLEEKVEQRTAELQALNRELESFNYSVAHDLRTPLRGINGFSQLLAEGYRDKLDEDGRYALERIHVGTTRMAELIDSLLKLAQLNRAEVRPQAIDLAALARSIMADLNEHNPEREVEVRIPEELPAVGDPDLMRAALENLLANAYKFTRHQQPACIELGATQADGETTYYVRDNGAGFDMKFADKLFRPFQRLHSPRDFEGTGIGLATVERVVRKHCGKIWADSQPGDGAAFYFTLNV